VADVEAPSISGDGVCGRRRLWVQRVALGKCRTLGLRKRTSFAVARHAHLVELRGVLEHLVDGRARRVGHSRPPATVACLAQAR